MAQLPHRILLGTGGLSVSTVGLGLMSLSGVYGEADDAKWRTDPLRDRSRCEPMTNEFGWSRTAISGAVSLGGLLAAFAAPWLGRLLDLEGARLVLCVAILTTGLANLALSLTGSLWMFYVLFCVARMNFAGPFDLGIYGAVNSWFITRRSLANAIASMGQMTGLVVLPMIASLAMLTGGWREGWLAIGTTVLMVGFVPAFLLMVRSPEDAGLLPDGGLVSGPRPRRARSGLSPCSPAPRRSGPKFLVAHVVYVAGLSGAGWGQSASGSVSDRTRPQFAGRRIGGQFLLADVGDRQLRLRRAAETLHGALETGADRVAAVRWKQPVPVVHSAASGYLAAAFFGPGVGGLLVCSRSPGRIISAAAITARSEAWP